MLTWTSHSPRCKNVFSQQSVSDRAKATRGTLQNKHKLTLSELKVRRTSTSCVLDHLAKQHLIRLNMVCSLARTARPESITSKLGNLRTVLWVTGHPSSFFSLPFYLDLT